MTAAAVCAVALVVGGWLAIRWFEETERIDNICALIMSVDLDDDIEVGS